MCGHVGFRHLLACCRYCKGSTTHRYCLEDEVVYDATNVRFVCYECDQKHEEELKNVPVEKEPGHAHSGSTVQQLNTKPLESAMNAVEWRNTEGRFGKYYSRKKGSKKKPVMQPVGSNLANRKTEMTVDDPGCFRIKLFGVEISGRPRGIVSSNMEEVWGNNCEASSSTAQQHKNYTVEVNAAAPPLVLTWHDPLEQTTHTVPTETESQPQDVQSEVGQEAPAKPAQKRKPRKKRTLIVEDKHRRSARLNKSRSMEYRFFALPEKKRSKKQISTQVSEPEQLRDPIEIEQAQAINNNQMIPIPVLQNLGAPIL